MDWTLKELLFDKRNLAQETFLITFPGIETVTFQPPLEKESSSTAFKTHYINQIFLMQLRCPQLMLEPVNFQFCKNSEELGAVTQILHLDTICLATPARVKIMAEIFPV